MNRNNIEDWQEKYWDANNEKAEQAKCLMAATDQCCFREFNCPTPSQLEDENRFNGVLDSLWDHIEMGMGMVGLKDSVYGVTSK